MELFEGELLALLGPNGAGKTTLIRALSGRVRLDKGTIEMFGRLQNGSRRESLGVVPQEIALYPMLTAQENLEVFGRLCGVPHCDLGEKTAWALTWTGLSERASEPIKRFSGGMKRRLNLACSVLHNPRVLLRVDPEPRDWCGVEMSRLRLSYQSDGECLFQTGTEAE